MTNASQWASTLPPEDALPLLGQIPVVVHLHASDVVCGEPAPLTFLLPRTTLLLAVLQTVCWRFAPFVASAAVDPQRTQLWFAVKTHPHESLAGLESHRPAQAVESTATDGSELAVGDPLSTLTSTDDYAVSWLLPVGSIKDFAVEARRRAVWLHAHGGGLSADGTGRPSSAHSTAPLITSDSDAFNAFPLVLNFHFHQFRHAHAAHPSLPFHLRDDAVRSGRYATEETHRVLKYAFTALYGTTAPLMKLLPPDKQVLMDFAHLGTRSPPSSLPGWHAGDADLGTTLSGVSAVAGGPVVTSDSTQAALLAHHLARYHTVFTQFRKDIQRGSQKNAYVALAFPLDGLVRAVSPSRPRESGAADGAEPAPTTLATTTTTPQKSSEPAPSKGGGRRCKRTARTGTKPSVNTVELRPLPVPFAFTWTRPELFEAVVVPLHDTSSSSPTAARPTAAAALTFGALLWRLFRDPCRARRLSGAPPPQTMMEALLDALVPFYDTDDANSGKDAKEDGSSAHPDAVPHLRFCAEYESAPRGFALQPPSDSSQHMSLANPLVARLSAHSRVLFQVQGIHPSLATPLLFLEEYMTSADRTLYVTATVVSTI